MLKSVKIRQENYEWLVSVAGELQKERRKPVSIDEALSWLQKKGDITTAAGSWHMSDKEYKLFIKKVRAEWGKWKPEFA